MNTKLRDVGSIELMTESEYLQSRVNDQIDWLSEKAAGYQKNHKISHISKIVLGSLIPFFAASKFTLFTVESVTLAACFGVSITIIEGITSVQKNQELWVQYRTTCESLKREKNHFLTRTGLYKNEANTFSLFVENIENILSNENEFWGTEITKIQDKKEQA